MSKKQPQPAPAALQTIDPTQLDQVSGGTTRATSTTTTSSANDDLYNALNGISKSLTDLAHNQSGGGLNMNEMMLLIMMMGSRQQPTVVTTQPAAPAYPGYPGGGWPWGY